MAGGWVRGLAVAAGALLAACDEVDGFDGASGGYDEAAAGYEALYGRVDALAPSNPSALPTTGTASYDGAMSVTVADDASPTVLVGDLSLDVDLGGGDDPISGRASNFVGSDDQEYDGALALSGGALVRPPDDVPDASDDDLSFGLGGTLTDEAGGDFDFEGAGVGAFRGDGTSGVIGEVEGAVLTPNGTADFDGSFAGER